MIRHSAFRPLSAPKLHWRRNERRVEKLALAANHRKMADVWAIKVTFDGIASVHSAFCRLRLVAVPIYNAKQDNWRTPKPDLLADVKPVLPDRRKASLYHERERRLEQNIRSSTRRRDRGYYLYHVILVHKFQSQGTKSI